jgi:uncharacterized protein YebE (UPF0316 family)
MAEIIFFNSEVLTVVILSILIFCARIIDVTIGTIRLVYISKGYKSLAPILGFFEVLIWLIAVQQILSNLNHWIYYIFYAAGFATGTYIGTVIEDKLSESKVLVRIITKRDMMNLDSALTEKNYSYVNIDGVDHNLKGSYPLDVKILFLVVSKKKVIEVLDILKENDPLAKYSIEDVRYAKQDHPLVIRARNRFSIKRFVFNRMGK